MRETDRREPVERALDLAAPLVVPAALTLLAGVSARALGRLDAGQLAVAAWLPAALFAAAWFACLRFNRTRLGFTLVVCALAYLLTVAVLPGLEPGAAHLLGAGLAVCLPINLVVFALWPERGDLGSVRDPRWLVLLAQAALLLGRLFSPLDPATTWLAWQPSPALAALTPLSLPALIAWAVALGVAAGRLASQPSAQRGALLAVSVLVAVVLHSADPSLAVALLGTTAVILGIAAVQEGWGLAYLDTLTGLPGRRALDEALARQHGRYAVAMLDVDHFKAFNDRHGHAVGDEVLRMVASFLREVRGGGLPHRYGGEEFTVLFPSLAAEQALPHLEAVRQAIADAAFELRQHDRRQPAPPEPPGAGPEPLSITVSIGVADSGEGRRRPEAVIGLADEALYAAKRGGRDQTRVHAKEMP